MKLEISANGSNVEQMATGYLREFALPSALMNRMAGAARAAADDPKCPPGEAAWLIVFAERCMEMGLRESVLEETFWSIARGEPDATTIVGGLETVRAWFASNTPKVTR